MKTHDNFGGYVRFKKKLRRNALIKSLIFGLSCGLLSAAGVMLYQKLMTHQPALLLYLPIGAGVAVVLGLLAFLILRPSDRRIAYKLDRDLALGEKVQTMLAFEHEDSEMLTLQREDADRRLQEAPKSAVRDRRAWVHAFAPVLACALLTVAIITPVKAVELPPEEPEPPFELSSWQETALAELIEEVKASDMESAPKQVVVEELETLLDSLRVTATEKDMKAMVITVISNLNSIIREHNSANVFSPCMSASQHGNVAAMAMAMDMLSGLELREALTDARESLRVEEVAEPLKAYADGLADVIGIAKDNRVPENDKMYMGIEAFVKTLSDLHRQLGDYTRDWAQTQLDKIFNDASDQLNDALFIQYTNKDVKDMAVTRLMEIFDIAADELPEEEKVQLPNTNDEPDGDEKDEEDKGSQGGIGNMEVLYGSDDMIFDPVKNEYVKYGDVINEYYAGVSEKIIDKKIPDTLEQFISDYFDTLYDGSEKETAE